MLWTKRKSHAWHRGKKGKLPVQLPHALQRQRAGQAGRGTAQQAIHALISPCAGTESDNNVNWKGSLKAAEQKLLGCPIIGSGQSQAVQCFEQADQVKERCPCSWQGGCTKCSLKVLSNSNSSVFPWVSIKTNMKRWRQN